MNIKIARLRAQVRADRDAANSQIEALAGLDVGIGDPGEDAQAALALHHAYAAIESIIERCTLAIEGSRPTGPDSHRALLDSAALEIPGVRPPLVSLELVAALKDLRTFRHFLHHAYMAKLDTVRLAELRTAALALRPTLDRDLDALDARLAALASATGNEP